MTPRHLLPLLCLAGCQPDVHRHIVNKYIVTSPGPTGTPTGEPTSTGTGTGTGTGTATTAPNAHLIQGASVVCTDPTLRTTAYYERVSAANLPATTESTWGAGMIVADFTGDGSVDMFVPGETSQHYWISRMAPDPAEARWTRINEDWVDDLELDQAVGGIAGDIDADGDLDLVITRWEEPNVILLNDGQGMFTDATPLVFGPHSHKTQSANLADFDGDGDLDLFFGSYGTRPDGWNDPNMPAAEPSELYRNDGGGAWTDLSGWLPDELNDGYTFMSVAIDLNGDNLPELFSAHDFGVTRPSALLWNRGNWVFDLDLDFHPGWEDMGVGVGDPNEDGAPDFIMTSARSISVLQSGDGLGLPGTWIESNDSWGIDIDLQGSDQYFGWGVDWGDLDNDSDLDAVGLMGFWTEWDHLWGPGQKDAMWEQTGPLSFEQRGADPLWDLDDGGAGRGLVLVDWNQDGWLDVIKRQVDDWTLMYTANCGDESWLEVTLDAPAPNTQAIGAVVRATIGTRTHTRWIMAGSTGMYSGQPPEAHFGLGDEEWIDELRVLWPDGEESVFNDVSARQRLTVVRD